jgi:phage terminase large subunit-like protein
MPISVAEGLQCRWAPFSVRSWPENVNPVLRLEDFAGQGCHLGLDLASCTDLAALALVFPGRDPDTGRVTYTAFARCYLNEAAVLEARNPAYPGWAAAGALVLHRQ